MAPANPAHSPAARQVVTGLAKVGLFLKSQARREAHPLGLTPTQLEILALLQRRFRGGAGLGELAEALAVTAATASAAVDALVRKGLVSKRRDRTDARAVELHLTPKGRRLDAGSSEWPEALMAAVDDLSGPERAVLLRSLLKMIRGLQSRHLIPVARMCAGCRFFRSGVHPEAERPHHCDFVDAPFGDGELRLDCEDYEAATPEAALRAWSTLTGVERGSPASR
jgi:DNA-binding MarR family transcriptional regulator